MESQASQGCDHTILPDMIEIGSFIGMAAMTESEITIKNVSYDNLGIIPDSFRRLGISLKEGMMIYLFPSRNIMKLRLLLMDQ